MSQDAICKQWHEVLHSSIMFYLFVGFQLFIQKMLIAKVYDGQRQHGRGRVILWYCEHKIEV